MAAASHSNPDRLLKLEEVAERLGVHRDTVRHWVYKGLIPAIRLPGNAGRRIRESELEAWLSNRSSPVIDEPGPGGAA